MFLNDSIFNTTKNNQIQELNAKFNYEKKQKENEILIQKNKLIELKVNQLNEQIIFLLIIAILISVLSYILYRRNKSKFRINKLLQEKNEQIELQNRELKEANSTKDKFFSIIAHDLKSPFAGFLGLTKIMAEEIQNLTLTEMHDFSKIMKISADNLYKLLENLLEWARMQRGVTNFIPDIFQLQLIVRMVLEVQEEVANQKDIELVVKIPEDIKISVDLSMFNTILRNLISNAIKFTPRGGKVEIGTIIEPSEDFKLSAGSISIYVKDSGIGMSQDTIDKLFKLDQKISHPGTEGEPSSGLGLLLCKEFVDKHNGEIRVESEAGKGSTFYINLPKIIN